MIESRRFSWKGERLLYEARPVQFDVVADVTYPHMWRIRSPDGTRSDIVNLTRARDAAIALAAAFLKARETAAEAPLTRQCIPALLGVP